jgi:hypothetical protein
MISQSGRDDTAPTSEKWARRERLITTKINKALYGPLLSRRDSPATQTKRWPSDQKWPPISRISRTSRSRDARATGASMGPNHPWRPMLFKRVMGLLLHRPGQGRFIPLSAPRPMRQARLPVLLPRLSSTQADLHSVNALSPSGTRA